MCVIIGSIGLYFCYHLSSVIGYYSTTSFAGIGKQKALKLIKENIDDFADLINESACLDVSCDEVVDTVEFICLLYDSISNCC